MEAKIAGSAIIEDGAILGEGVVIGERVIVEQGAILGDRVFVDTGTIIRKGVVIGNDSKIGANCILGEYQNDFFEDPKVVHPLTIGDHALIRSGSILYGGSRLGAHFQTGHRVTIREKAVIGEHVSVGTLSDIQGHCRIGHYVRMHSNVHIGQASVIDSFAWIYPYVVLTNDPTPPSEIELGVHVHPFAVVATGSIVMPGKEIGQDALVGAGAIVTKDVAPYQVSGGNPAKPMSDVRKILDKTTKENLYPWRYHFDRYMPWEGSDFLTWKSGLSEEEITYFHLDQLDEGEDK